MTLTGFKDWNPENRFLLYVAVSVIAFALLVAAVLHSVPEDSREPQMMFTKDGITVYSFRDQGSTHYFTSRGETITPKSCGKGCMKDEVIK